jgi:hypothetical protein
MMPTAMASMVGDREFDRSRCTPLNGEERSRSAVQRFKSSTTEAYIYVSRNPEMWKGRLSIQLGGLRSATLQAPGYDPVIFLKFSTSWLYFRPHSSCGTMWSCPGDSCSQRTSLCTVQ